MGGKRALGAATATLVAAAVAVVSAGVVLAARDVPRQAVAAVDVGALTVPASVGSGESAGSGQQVAALDGLEGRLKRRGDDAEGLSIGVVSLDFGPEDWVQTAGALQDFDRDGTPERLLDELEGLVGQPVTALVRLDDDGDEADVFELNGLRYRDSAGGPAPWQRAGATTGNAATVQEVSNAARAAVGPGARVRELDRGQDAGVAWEADVIAQDGQEWDVLLDVAGEVLDAGVDD